MKPPMTAPATPITMFTIGPYPPSCTSLPVSQPVISPTMTDDKKYMRPPLVESLPYLSSLLPESRNDTFHPVQIPVRCPKEFSNRLAAIGIVRNADAYRNVGLLVVRNHLFA